MHQGQLEDIRELELQLAEEKAQHWETYNKLLKARRFNKELSDENRDVESRNDDLLMTLYHLTHGVPSSALRLYKAGEFERISAVRRSRVRRYIREAEAELRRQSPADWPDL